MRLMNRDLQTVFLKKRIIDKDEEANEIKKWGDPKQIMMVIQSAGGSVNAQIYGEKLSSMKSCKYQGNLIQEGNNESDGICVYVDKEDTPDYIIQSIQPFSTHTNVILERNEGRGS